MNEVFLIVFLFSDIADKFGDYGEWTVNNN